jgi:hypothetical protein
MNVMGGKFKYRKKNGITVESGFLFLAGSYEDFQSSRNHRNMSAWSTIEKL